MDNFILGLSYKNVVPPFMFKMVDKRRDLSCEEKIGLFAK
jgi:hypothetical protein